MSLSFRFLPCPHPAWVVAAAIGLWFLPGCGREERLAAPIDESPAWTDSLVWSGPPPCAFPAGRWIWRIEISDAPDAPQTAILHTAVAEDRFHWRWTGPVDGLDSGAPALLAPADSTVWHAIELDSPGPGSLRALPLPRLPCDSGSFDHLLGLLQTLTGPFFGGKVTHWPEIPVPVRTGQAVAGLVDLSACLAEAAAIWNRDEERPWFRLDQESGWGVRLIHFPDIRLQPPLEARITRLDDGGAPLRIQIVAGNNYDSLREPKYVVRGFVHELGHALFLWGHSPDREHCLWGAAPPIVDQPSPDERKAARLWHGLPEGLDLSRYR